MVDAHSWEATSASVTVDGLRLHYHDAGSGPPLVLLHGSGPGVSGWANFGGNLPSLAEHFRCLVLDQPGFGSSERPARYERNYLRIAADAVRGFLDSLAIPRAHILGNSMGGAVAVRFALEHSDRVDRMVLMAPGGVGVPVLGPQPSEGIKRLLEFNADPTRERLTAWLRTMVSDESMLTEELVERRYAEATVPGAITALRDTYATFSDPALADSVPLWAELGRLNHPVLLAWGQDDRVTPVEGALLPARQLCNADLRIFGNCGHWVQIERRDAFERSVVDFLGAGL
ncbi:alpha/beta fold hydrolase [Haloechinothrix sp. YIM 98757]|uniref:Alpha/beta fold hydrolase n=1 Tax=Haloechinothrix aidingensis TaxID=2752311 RepID=A0A838ABC3_9PSEU|nr:alpha/beta fold hydrolase [Haloechinothrix aidingensis]MBA0126539.1 alpha/beta fold hydrolase [Haloechinothrix aidingensis]